MTIKAQEEAAQHRSNWVKEYSEHNVLKKLFGEQQAALEELRARTACVVEVDAEALPR